MWLQEEARVVLIRFGSDADPTCMQMDEVCVGLSAALLRDAVHGTESGFSRESYR